MNAIQKVLVRMLGLKGDMATAGMSRGAYTLKDPAFVNSFGAPTYAGKSVTDNSALQVSTAWACVRILAETIGSLPVSIYERDEKGNAQKIDHDLSPLFVSAPNADMTKVEYFEAKTTNLALRGNAYSMIERNGAGNVSSLYPMSSLLTEPKRADSGTVYYEFQDRGKTVKLPQEKVWHIKGFGSDGLTGLSPVAYARQSLGMALAAEEFQARFFANGANPSYIIEVPDWLTPEQRRDARENINRLWVGLDQVHRAQLLEGGMKATAATMPLEDAQFMQLRGFSIQEVCRIYRIPPHMVMDLSRSTNNNIEHQGQEFVMFTLAPYLTRIEASFSKWLLKPEERSKYFLRFNVDALLRADAAGRAALYSSGLQNGWMSRNEVRALENRNTVDEEGMDSYTAQSNLLPVEVIFDDEKRNESTSPPPGSRSIDDESRKIAEARWHTKDPAQTQPTIVLVNAGSSAHEGEKRLTVDVPGLRELAEGLAKQPQDTGAQQAVLMFALKGAVDGIAATAQLAQAENALELKAVSAEFCNTLAMTGAEQVAAFKGLSHSLGAMLNQAREDQAGALKGVLAGLQTLIDMGGAEKELVFDENGDPVRVRIASH